MACSWQLAVAVGRTWSQMCCATGNVKKHGSLCRVGARGCKPVQGGELPAAQLGRLRVHPTCCTRLACLLRLQACLPACICRQQQAMPCAAVGPWGPQLLRRAAAPPRAVARTRVNQRLPEPNGPFGPRLKPAARSRACTPRAVAAWRRCTPARADCEGGTPMMIAGWWACTVYAHACMCVNRLVAKKCAAR